VIPWGSHSRSIEGKEHIHEVYNDHLCLNPSKLEMQAWGETGFRFELQGYRFMVIAGQNT